MKLHTPSPAERVFAITELLEFILLELPMKDLYVIQRVCRTIQLAIAGGSDILKKKMFVVADGAPIRPDLPYPSIPYGDDQQGHHHHICYNTLHFRLNPAATAQKADEYNNGRVHGPRSSKIKPPAVVSIDDYGNCWKFNIWVTLSDGDAWKRGVDSPNATWRNTFLTQPPTVAVSCSLRPWSQSSCATLSNPKGLRLGELHDLVTELCQKYPVPEFSNSHHPSLIADFVHEQDPYAPLTLAFEECAGKSGTEKDCECMRLLFQNDVAETSEEMETLLRLCRMN